MTHDTRMALGQLLEAHRHLVRAGFEPQALVLAQALLDRVHVTDGGSGVLEGINSMEALAISHRVIDAAAPDDRDMVRRIVIGV